MAKMRISEVIKTHRERLRLAMLLQSTSMTGLKNESHWYNNSVMSSLLITAALYTELFNGKCDDAYKRSMLTCN